MINVYIIDRLKKEKERQEQEWQPLQIPLENPDSRGGREDRESSKKKDKSERGIAILSYQV